MRESYIRLDKETRELTTIYLWDLGYREYLITEVQTSKNARGKGHASRLLREVCTQADEEQAVLMLHADPDGSEWGLGLDQLVAWYRRLGFTPVESSEFIDIDKLVRYPKGIEGHNDGK